jgi:hypothetical protein
MEIAIAMLVLTALGTLGAYLFIRYSRRGPAERSEYARRRPLNTHEQALYWRLVKTLPDHVILAQVAMKRCIASRGPNAEILARESLDFVVCNKSMRMVAAIEIEDNAHARSEYREKVREIKEEALDAAGIRLITCSSQSLLSEAYISMEFNNHSSLMARLVA